MFGDEIALARVQGKFRFELLELTSTFPYPRGSVRVLRDHAALWRVRPDPLDDARLHEHRHLLLRRAVDVQHHRVLHLATDHDVPVERAAVLHRGHHLLLHQAA